MRSSSSLLSRKEVWNKAIVSTLMWQGVGYEFNFVSTDCQNSSGFSTASYLGLLIDTCFTATVHLHPLLLFFLVVVVVVLPVRQSSIDSWVTFSPAKCNACLPLLDVFSPFSFLPSSWITFIVDLATRFGSQFKDPVTLPRPDPMTKTNKQYASVICKLLFIPFLLLVLNTKSLIHLPCFFPSQTKQSISHGNLHITVNFQNRTTHTRITCLLMNLKRVQSK